MGGGVMRAAAKMAGIGAATSGLRGVQAVSPAEHPVSAAARKVSRPVSTIASQSSSQPEAAAAVASRPSWEVDDWEFAGGEEELFLDSVDPLPRLVFGGAPTFEEAKSATADLKDALEMASFTSDHKSSLPLVSDFSETKACITSENSVVLSGPKHAIQAFKLLKENPAAQTVVASIVSDQSVWDAVMQNTELTEFLQSHKTTDAAYFDGEMDEKGSVASRKESVADSSDLTYANTFETIGSGFTNFVQNIRLSVAEMANKVSDFFQNVFVVSEGESKAAGPSGSARAAFMQSPIGASFMALAVMVIMVVVIKRA